MLLLLFGGASSSGEVVPVEGGVLVPVKFRDKRVVIKFRDKRVKIKR